MALNLKTSKPATRKNPRSHYVTHAPACRRCGEETCNCTDEELDAGGPAL